MESIQFKAKVRSGGVQTSASTHRTRLEFELHGGQSLAMAQLIELMERGIVAKLDISGDKGTHEGFSAIVWKVRTTIDGGICFVFELDKGSAIIAARMGESSLALEQLDVTVTGDEEYGIPTWSFRKSQRQTEKREYPN